MTLFDEAIIFAVQCHSGAFRKGSDIPYILHPMEAAAIAGALTEDPEILAAAVLHDTVEDTDCTPEEIRARFGPRVAALVAEETENKRPELDPALTWRRRKEETIAALAACSDPAPRMIAFGDKLSNLRAMYRDYLRIGDALWLRFHQTDPMEHCWYYRSMGELFSPFAGRAVWQEYWRVYRRLWPDAPLPAEVHTKGSGPTDYYVL